MLGYKITWHVRLSACIGLALANVVYTRLAQCGLRRVSTTLSTKLAQYSLLGYLSICNDIVLDLVLNLCKSNA